MSLSDSTLPTITFTITNFHKITGHKKYCEYTMALADGGSTVSIDPATNAITVKSGAQVQIVFTAAGNYLLAGICFKETDEGNSDPNGVAAFPTVALSLSSTSSTLTLTDAGTTTTDFEYAILVVGIDEKALGLIDPPIFNRPPAEP